MALDAVRKGRCTEARVGLHPALKERDEGSPMYHPARGGARGALAELPRARDPRGAGGDHGLPLDDGVFLFGFGSPDDTRVDQVERNGGAPGRDLLLGSAAVAAGCAGGGADENEKAGGGGPPPGPKFGPPCCSRSGG